MPRPEDIRKGSIWTGRMLRDLFLRERTTITGARGVTAGGAGTRQTITGPPRRGLGLISFMAFVQSATRDGTSWRWTYDFSEVTKNDSGYGSWFVKANGRTGTAYNLLEDINLSTGITGAGVEVPISVPGFELKPVPPNVPLPFFELSLIEQDTYEYWFLGPNGVDGTCQDPVRVPSDPAIQKLIQERWRP